MANDRLYLRCNVCNVGWFLAKHYEDGWYRTGMHDKHESAEDFLDAHTACFFAGPPKNQFSVVDETEMFVTGGGTAKGWPPGATQ